MPAPVSYWSLLSCTLLIGFNFLALDLLRRLSDELLHFSPGEILANVAVVGSHWMLIAALVALVLRGVEKLRTGVTGPLLYLLLYTVNVTFLKYRFGEAYESLSPSLRTWVSLAALVLALPIGLLARDFLRELRSLVSAGGRTLALLLSVPFLGLSIACALPGPEAPAPQAAQAGTPDILLLTVDTLAARDMSLYGYERPTTPNLERWAREFAVFENAHSVSNTTNTSVPSFQGFYYGTLDPAKSLATRLEQAGYRDNLWISFHRPEFFGLPAPEQVEIVHAAEETAYYQALRGVYERRELAWLSALMVEELPYFVGFFPQVGVEYHRFWSREHHSARVSLELAVQHLVAPRDAPTFVWVHLWQPHYPYLPRPPFEGTFDSAALPSPPLNNSIYSPGSQELVDRLRRRYDEYVLQVDDEIDRFLNRLESQNALDRTLVIISSDHGESFRDGYVGHGGFSVREPLVHIPLMLRFPAAEWTGRIRTFTTPLDLMPTVLEYLKLPVPAGLAGESLWPYLRDPERLSQVPKLSISYKAYTEGEGQIAVYSGRYKVVFEKQDRKNIQVYDLMTDPGETADLVDRFREQAEATAESVQW